MTPGVTTSLRRSARGHPFLPYLAQAWGQPLWRGRINTDRPRFRRASGVIGARRIGTAYFSFSGIIVGGGCIVIGTDAVAQVSLKNALKILGLERSIQPAKDEGFTLLGLPAESGAGLGSSRGASEC